MLAQMNKVQFFFGLTVYYSFRGAIMTLHGEFRCTYSLLINSWLLGFYM